MRALEKVVVLALVTGCPARPTLKDPHPGEYQLTFHNVAGGSICGFYLFPIAQTNEGINRLEPTPELRSGEFRRLWILPGDYQIRVTGCPFEKLDLSGFMTNIKVEANATVAFYREDDAKSSETAMHMAHEKENTFLIAAKVQLVPHPTSRTAPKELDSEKPPL